MNDSRHHFYVADGWLYRLEISTDIREEILECERFIGFDRYGTDLWERQPNTINSMWRPIGHSWALQLMYVAKNLIQKDRANG